MPNPRRQVRNVARPGIYGRPQPVRQRSRSKLPELRINGRALATLVVLSLGLVWWWRVLAVKTIQVSGNQSYSAETVTVETKNQISRHWWWHNLMLLDTRGLQKNLLAALPQYADIAISRQGTGTVKLVVTEREPNMEWQTGDKVYLLSKEGIAVEQLGQTDPHLPRVEDTTNLPVKLGDQVAPARLVSFTLAMAGLLPKQGLQITQMKVPETTSELNVTVNQGYYIKFDTTREAADEAGDLAKVLNLLKSQNKKPAEYIDLRVDGKAYYK